MSLDFATATVTLTNVTLGNPRSFVMWVRPDTQGTSNLGGILKHGTGNGRTMLRWNGSAGSSKLQILSDRSTDGIWVMTTGFATFSAWHFVGLVYDGSSTSNDPVLYVSDGSTLSILTVGSGLTESSAPSGSEQSEALTLVLGQGNGSDAEDGKIGEFACWANRGLSGAEMAGIFVNGVMQVPGAYLYWSMDRQTNALALDLSGNGRHGTVASATVAENPPIRPAGRRG